MSQFSEDFLKVYSKAHSASQGWIRLKKKAHSKNISRAELTNRAEIFLRRSVRDLDDNSFNNFLEHYHAYYGEEGETKWETQSVQAAPRSSTGARSSISSISPCGNIELNFYNSPLKKGETTGSYVEVLHSCPHVGIFRYDLTKYHGKIVGDSWFGGSCWDGESFVYVAQVNRDTVDDKKVKRTSILESIGEEESSLAGKKFEFVEDWGEKFEGVNDLGLFILNVFTGKISQVPFIDLDKYTVGQPTLFSIKDDKLSAISNESVFRHFLTYTAWDITPRRQGMIYCYHRKCQVYLQEVTLFIEELEAAESEFSLLFEKPLLLTEGLNLARSSRFSSKTNKLYFLGREEQLFSHGGNSELFSVDFTSFENGKFQWEKLVGTVDSPQVVDNSLQFPGLFLDSLIGSPFDVSGQVLLTETAWGNTTKIVAINTLKKENNIVTLNFEGFSNDIYSFSLLDFHNDLILVSFSSAITPHQYFLVDLKNLIEERILNSIDTEIFIKKELMTFSNSPSRIPISHKLSAPSCSYKSLSPSPWKKKMIFKNFYHTIDGIPFSSFLLSPFPTASLNSIPLILIPHGGPHSNSSTSFLPSYYFLASSLNVGILHINYRGSTGFGSKSIESLLGNIGMNDVNDVIYCLDKTLELEVKDVITEEEIISFSLTKTSKLFNSSSVAIVGGSHGGFLAAHACGQFSSKFKACCLRNPVTNIPSMTGISDIPDWCHVEATGNKELFPKQCSSDVLLQMLVKSPVHHIDKYNTPTLICLGAKDKRVPYSQGLEFHQFLKMKGITSKLLVFPEDVHAIDIPVSETEHWLSIANFLHEHLN